jgi:hypothetical protein
MGDIKKRVAKDEIIPGPTIEGIVVARPTRDRVVSITSVHNVVTPGFPKACRDSIIPCPTIDRIIAEATDDIVIARAAYDKVIPCRSKLFRSIDLVSV